MPYSRLDGDLFLMVTRGEGRSEFEEFGIGGAPPPSTQTTPAKPKESEKKKPEEAPAAPPTLSVPELDKNGATKTIEDLRSFRNQAVSPFDAVIESRGGMLDGRIQGYRTFQLRNEGENWQRLLVTLEGLFSDLNRRAIWIRGNYDAWIVSGDEIDGAIEKAAFALSRHLAKSGFGLAFDIPPEVLADEIERRERVDLENLYPRLRGGASVQDGFMELGERRREFFEDDKGLQLLLAEIEKVLAELKKEDLPKGKK
ncbi:MAG: hypothetical protein KDD47_18585, partial [Acidobacteria bacterium]|nr:hypothetical protein [Acidobacteriota bacterium]